MSKILEIAISSKITKSYKYQSGSGEFSLVASLSPNEDFRKAYVELRDEVVKLANDIANESLQSALTKKGR